MVISGQTNLAAFALTAKYTCCLVTRSSGERGPMSRPGLGITNSDDHRGPDAGGKPAWWELESLNREDRPTGKDHPAGKTNPQETSLEPGCQVWRFSREHGDSDIFMAFDGF